MQAATFIQSVYSTLTQQGSTMLVSRDTLVTYLNFALCDLYTYEGRSWSFFSVYNQSVTTPGTGSYFEVVVPEAPFVRLQSLRARR